MMRNLYTLDDVLIASTKVDREHAPLSTLFDGHYFTRYKQDTYRPVATLTSMVDHRLGIDPRHAGHAQNILWHAATSFLVLLLARRWLPPVAALVAGLFFAVHPAATEATVSIGYREDAMVALFLVSSLLLTWRGKLGERVLALVVYALALFTKENAIVFPALLTLARLTLERVGPLDKRAFARELAAFTLVTVGFSVVRFGVMASPDAFADAAGGTYAATLVAVPRIFAHYLRLLVAPWRLLVLYAHMFPLGASFASQVPWLLLDLAFLAGSVWLARTRPVLGFGLLWFALGADADTPLRAHARHRRRSLRPRLARRRRDRRGRALRDRAGDPITTFPPPRHAGLRSPSFAGPAGSHRTPHPIGTTRSRCRRHPPSQPARLHWPSDPRRE